jgi:hypothetical protein
MTGKMLNGRRGELVNIFLGMQVIMSNFKILVAAFGGTIFVMCSQVHATSFIIELNNGREVTTSRVWEEGNEIKFSSPQGTAGIPKSLVKRIKTSTVVYNDQSARRSISPSDRDAMASTAGEKSQDSANRETERRDDVGNGKLPQEQKSATDKSIKAGDAQEYRAKKLTLTSGLDEATNKYLAASGARNPDAKQAALDDMREYSKKIIDLGDEVKKKNGGVLPEWWNE